MNQMSKDRGELVGDPCAGSLDLEGIRGSRWWVRGSENAGECVEVRMTSVGQQGAAAGR